MDSRTEILKRLRDAAPAAPLPPDLRREKVPYADPLAQLEIALQAVAAVPVRVAGDGALAEAVRAPVASCEPGRLCVPAAGAGNVRPEEPPTRTSSRGSISRSCRARSASPRTARSG